MSPIRKSRSNVGAGLSRRGFLQGLTFTGANLFIAGRTFAQTNNNANRTSPPLHQPIESHVYLNQVGFLPKEPKRAVIPATGKILGNSFAIVDDAVIPEIRYHGTLTEYKSSAPYGHYPHHFFADFDGFQRQGRYRVRLSDGRLSTPFSIAPNIYNNLIPLILGYFDIQRCGEQKSAVREPCHLDDGIVVGGPRNGQKFDGTGGWHDAGDYLKFVETTSYVAALMLFSYDHYRHVFPGRSTESGLPLLLHQARVGLEWLLKMHPSPEEFYFQVGDESDHNGWRLPEADCLSQNKDWQARPVYFGVGANLAGRVAVALALASRLYREHDAEFAARCLSAAKSAYELGLKNPRVLSTRPADFYPEETWADDMEWAAIDLYKATGKKEYLEQALRFSMKAGPAYNQTSVYNTHALAHYTLYPYAPHEDKKRLLGYLKTDADNIRKLAKNPYGLGTPYIWGTAEAAAGAALSCLMYAELAKDEEAMEIARRQRDFILGCNPFGLCCVVGVGTRYPLFPHHQIANIKNIELSGAVVGGPSSFEIFKAQKIPMDNLEFSTQSASPIAAADRPDEIGVYHDAVQDFVTNEPANDYTAKFLLLAAFYIAHA